MTGTIKSLSVTSAGGFIQASDGSCFHFRRTEVFAGADTALAVGQAVVFDLKRGVNPSATKVRVLTPERASFPDHTYLQYLGFEQNGNLRTYRFKRISPQEGTKEFLVQADLALFTKHRVPIQEGPALAMQRLSPDQSAGGQAWPASQSLTEFDVLAYTAKRAHSQDKPGALTAGFGGGRETRIDRS